MIDRDHDLPLMHQAEMLNVNHNPLHNEPGPMHMAALAVMRRLEELHLDYPLQAQRRPYRARLMVRHAADTVGKHPISKFHSMRERNPLIQRRNWSSVNAVDRPSGESWIGLE